MLLSKSNIPFYLFTHGLIEIHANCDFDKIEEIISKNISFKVKIKEKNFFLKQFIDVQAEGNENFIQEAAFLYLVGSGKYGCELRNHIPRYIFHDVRHSIIIVELLEDHKKIFEFNCTDTLIVRTVSLINLMQQLKFPSSNSTEAPFPLLLTNFNNRENIKNKFLLLISSDKMLCNNLQEISKKWKREVLCHNDLKLQNILISSSKDIKIIDWEFLDYGDSMWDFACLLASYIVMKRSNYNIFTTSNNTVQTIKSYNIKFKEITAEFRLNWQHAEQIKFIELVGVAFLTKTVELVEKNEIAENLLTHGFHQIKYLISFPEKFINIFFHTHEEYP